LTTVESEYVEIRILREALVGVVPRPQVTPMLFEVLEPYGNLLPTGSQALRDMVRTTLREIVARRVGAVEADLVVERAEALITAQRAKLDTGEVTLPPHDASPAGAYPPGALQGGQPQGGASRTATGRDRDATALVPTVREAVTVMVIAGTQGLSTRLVALLGSSRVAPFVAGTPARVREPLEGRQSPAMLLVDATDFPPIAAEQLARLVVLGPPTMTRAVWGSDLPYGRSLMAALPDGGPVVQGIERAHGVSLLVDLVRARRA
jgi:hypothetical protein